jgi:signal transduction histidine kinase
MLLIRGRRRGTGLDAVHDTAAAAEVRAGRGQLQPLLFAVAGLLVVPYLLRLDAPWSVLLFAAVFVTWSIGLAWRRRVHGFTERRTALLGRIESAVAVVGYGILLVVDDGANPGAAILLGAGVVATVTVLDHILLRGTLQVTVILLAGGAVGAGGSWSDAGLVVALLSAVAALSSAYASAHLASRTRQRAARRDAERQGELLAAVQRLPTDSVHTAAQAVVRTLRELAYDGAGVELVRGDELELVHIEGLPAIRPPRRGEGFAWRCIEERATVTTDAYLGAPGRRTDRYDVHAAVATPILVGEEPVGAVVGMRLTAAAPTAAEVEIAEVLAAHLGGVLGRLRQEHRQQEQLDRLRRLEHLRAGFVGAITAELRDPLADVRAVSATLVRAPRLANEPQEELLELLGRRTDELRRTIDAILEVSRFQAQRRTPVPGPVEVESLLRPCLDASGAALGTDPEELAALGPVEVDTELVRHALELLLQAGPRRVPGGTAGSRVEVRAGPGQVVVELHRVGGPPTGVVRSLASQLLLAAGGSLDQGSRLALRLPLAGPGEVRGHVITAGALP